VADVDGLDSRLDSWNVSPDIFARQLQALAGVAEFVALRDLPLRLAGRQIGARPLVSLTFDDGFANFRSSVVPLLDRYHIPATLFLPTGYVGSRGPMPFDRWSQRNQFRAPADAWRPLDWQEVEECLDSDLVSIGGHSHRHMNAALCSPAQMREEAQRSREVLESRLGADHARMYAYPYGCSRLGQVPDPYVDAVRQAGYELAVSTDLGVATRQSEVYRLPRVEGYGLDSPAILRAKVRGCLAPYFLTDRLRKAKRSA
jgi:peptidoglycan/xylan/chitin deacetylase (PgdA/CDA1 family)